MNRLITGIILFSAILAFGVYHKMEYEHHMEYPDFGDIVSDPSRYIEEKVAIVEKEVIDVGDNGFSVMINNRLFTVTNAPGVDVGDRVEVLGILEPDYRISAEKIIVYKEWKYYFIFIRSATAIPLLLFLFFKSWRFDFKRFEFRGRE